MDYRKLIKFGNSSHIVSLPTSWIKKNKLKKGDLIYFEENGNGEIVLSSELKADKADAEIFIESNTLEGLKRKLISSYVAGYTTITIGLKDLNNLAVIRGYLDSLMSFEIIEQTSNKIVAKDLLDIKEIAMDKIIRRIDTVIRSMADDTKTSFKVHNYDSIYKRDSDINRLTFLSYRIIKKCLDHPRLIDSVGLEYKKLINVWMLVFNLERIGDEIKRIARYLTKLKQNKETNDVVKIYTEVYDEYVRCMNAWYKKDINTAYDVSEKKDEVIDKCNKLAQKSTNRYIFNIFDKIKTLETCIRDISRAIYQEKL